MVIVVSLLVKNEELFNERSEKLSTVTISLQNPNLEASAQYAGRRPNGCYYCGQDWHSYKLCGKLLAMHAKAMDKFEELQTAQQQMATVRQSTVTQDTSNLTPPNTTNDTINDDNDVTNPDSTQSLMTEQQE